MLRNIWVHRPSIGGLAEGILRHRKTKYHTNIIEHYENPKNIGSLDNKRLDVGQGLVGAPACGDVMKLDIMVSTDGIIIDSKFKTFGCGSAIASSSLMTELVKNKPISEAYLITNKAIAKELMLPPVKLHCSMLAEDAIKSAINDYLKKNNLKDIDDGTRVPR